ncbi:dynamin-related protein 4C-like isoform X2 [Arachis hypogaea]|uniref:dynamin-related protein 4C-like isoform X2 n=1 Tax=Arachis hypogaea TaxID=3818 RepID=UPI003B22151B
MVGTAKKTRRTTNKDDSLAVVHGENPQVSTIIAPIVSSYNEKIRPILDAVENLRRLNIAKEGIQLPTIVVVGDQISGKSSVLESLAGISLPRGQGICTRVPLVMRLQSHPLPNPELMLEFNGKSISTDEDNVSDAINIATDELAGNAKGISNTPLTLVVKKNGVPDLTMVDLPGITRVPVHGQPENIYDQIKDIIMEYIRPEESIILNVLSATVDFTTCESIRMSQSVDKTGLRTLAVVTKADKSPEGLLEKRLVQVQGMIISKTLPEIVKKINEKLTYNLSELDKLPVNLTCVADAMTAFMHIIGLSKESLRKILLRGEFDEYPDEKNMHCTARLVDLLDSYSNDLQCFSEKEATKDFLMDEIRELQEAKWIGLPNFMPRTAFLSIHQRKVKAVAHMPIDFVHNVWEYLETVVSSVLNRHCENYYQLQVSTRRAGQSLISKMKDSSVKHVLVVVEMEKLTDYTCNPEFIAEYKKLILQQDCFVKAVLDRQNNQTSKVKLEGVGEIDVAHLKQYSSMLTQAFDLKVRMIAYWRIVQKRFIDSIAMHLMLSIHNLVNKDLEKEIVHDLMSPKGGGIERLLEESPSIAGKRDKLNRSVKVLRESKETVGNLMDRIGTYGD